MKGPEREVEYRVCWRDYGEDDDIWEPKNRFLKDGKAVWGIVALGQPFIYLSFLEIDSLSERSKGILITVFEDASRMISRVDPQPTMSFNPKPDGYGMVPADIR